MVAPPSEQAPFPLDPELANATDGFEKMPVDGGVSGSAPVQNQITAPPTVSKKRKAGQLGELKNGKRSAVDKKSRGKAEKRGNGDKEALGEPIGTHPETTAQLPSKTVKNVSVTGINTRMDGEPANAVFDDENTEGI